MIYLYIKLEVKKNDTTAMTTTINEACIENCYLARGIFLVWEMSIFCCWAGFSPHLEGFPHTVGLGEGVRQSINGGGNKQDERRGNTFGKMGNTGGIIQGDILPDTVLY